MRQSPRKQVASRLYLHVDALSGADADLSARISAAEALAGLTRGDGYKLVRLDLDGPAVALLHYPGFFDDPFPALAASWLVDPQAGTATLRTYADSLNPPILHRKELLLPADHPRRAEFAALTEACEAIGLFDEPTRIGHRRQWLDLVREKGYRIVGHALIPLGNAEGGEGDAEEPPEDLTRFGQGQAARQLIACGETQARTGMPNLPREPGSFSALLDLAAQVLDPVIDWFGMVRLTFGFCSPELARAIPGRIDPKLDQHAAHERNRRGLPICPRLGAAVDFIVDDEDMLEVARWVVANTPFDRLYFYGSDLPIHVSFGPDHSRQVVRMVPATGGRLVPRVVEIAHFLEGGR